MYSSIYKNTYLTLQEEIMLKKIALLLAVVMLLSVAFVACGEKDPAVDDNNPSTDDTANDDKPAGTVENPAANVSIKIEDTADDEDNYFYNPKITAAYRVSDTVVRVKFAPRVTSPIYDPAPYIYASTDIFGGTKIKATKTLCLDPKVLGEDNNSGVYGMTYDVTFESAIPEDGYICFEETVDTDNDGALDNVLCDDTGAGLYAAYRPADKSAPVAAAKYTNDVIEASNVPTVLLRAYLASAETGTFIVEFSKPVTAIEGEAGIPGSWQRYCFVCDKVNPTPGKDGSWQYTAMFDPTPVDVQLGTDGLMYASKWEFTMDGSNYPESGVFRIQESYTLSDEVNSSEDNTLGRLIVGIDGVPLEASEAGKGSWDIAHCAYSSDDSYYIKGLSN